MGTTRAERARDDAARHLPSPRVRFGPGFAARVGRLAATLAAARERREGAGRARLFGAGAEFVGFRPYRPGEDLRQLDWSLFARTRKPFVRVTRREASEAWTVLLDASASMGVGTPGKLQLAAEVAAGATALALRLGATVAVVASDGRVLRLRAGTSLAPLLAFLERTEARGTLDWPGLVGAAEGAGPAGRVVALGDLCDLAPPDVLRLRRPGRELQVVRLLAPEELAPTPGAPREWLDPEDGARLVVAGEAGVVAAYDALLARELEDWGQVLRRHRVGYAVWSSARSFEDVLRGGLFDA